MKAGSASNSGGAQSVRKALLVLEEIAARQPVTVAVLARVLDLPKTTVQRSLTTLRDAGWLTQSDADRSWSLSSKVTSLASRAVSEFTLREAAAEPMRHLRDATGESVLLVERVGSSVVVIDIAPTTHVVRAVATIGTLLPLHASAGGKAMLAAGRGTKDQGLRKPLAKFTGNTIVDRRALAAELELVQRRGWAQQSSEFEAGVSSAAAAIPRSDGKSPAAAVVLFGPGNRLTDKIVERVAPLIIHAASEIASRLHLTWRS